MEILVGLIVALLIVSLVANAVLGVIVRNLLRRPNSDTVDTLKKEAGKVRKEKENIEKAFNEYRNRRDVLVIQTKEPINLDLVGEFTVDAIESGAGVYGDTTNVEAFISALYGIDASEELPPHMKYLLYEQRTKVALYTRKMDNKLRAITDGGN